MGLMERIKEIEAEMARTQKNKATNYHLGTLKAKLAKLRSELFLEQSGGGGSGGPGEGFDVARNGDARVALIGFPSVYVIDLNMIMDDGCSWRLDME